MISERVWQVSRSGSIALRSFILFFQNLALKQDSGSDARMRDSKSKYKKTGTSCNYAPWGPPKKLSFLMAQARELAMALLRMVAPRAGFRGDTRSGILWCHPLSCDASAAVTNLGENYVRMRMKTIKKKKFLPQITGVFGRKFGENVKILKL